MKNDSFIKKLQKRIPSIHIYAERGKYHAVHEGTLLTWRTSPKWDNKEVIEATGFHTKGVDQESDPYTDYYPGTFWSNGTQAIDRLCPPPNKFKAGQLVRGKDNKRAKRWGYAGKTALITKAPPGDRFVLQWIDHEDNHSSSYNSYYPTRDFELVSG
jgi:hypothetical protein